MLTIAKVESIKGGIIRKYVVLLCKGSLPGRAKKGNEMEAYTEVGGDKLEK